MMESKMNPIDTEKENLHQLCKTVRGMVRSGQSQQCRKMICDAMAMYPDAAQPHNLLGILLEQTGDNPGAMRHFRAAWYLDQGYLPARKNMERYGSFTKTGTAAYDEDDCETEEKKSLFKVEYDKRGIGYVVRREGNELI